MYQFVWTFCSKVEVCRHEDRFVLLVRSFIVPPIVFFGGGVFPFVWPTFFPPINDRYGVGVCGMLYLVADYYLVTKKLRERIPLLGLGFVRRRRFISGYLGECPNYRVG